MMKKISPFFAIVLALFAACQSKTSQSNSDDSTALNTTDSAAKAPMCYQSINNRDTAALTLNIDNEKVTGSLSYNIFEKDKNTGVIAGIVKGDTIIADYTFQSEGTTSIRQVAWLKQDNQLIEGFGDVAEVNGKTQFKDVKKLSFSKSMIFQPIDCK
ncbi:MAG: hypothetical protein ABWZ79_22010 [Pedobacter agri]